MNKKVMVSGCYDLIHAGHIAFFEEASALGDLYVCIGSDDTIQRLKGHPAMFSQAERAYLISHLACVKEVLVGSGAGMLDFAPELERLRPDLFFVNEDGGSPDKEALCRRFGVHYHVAKRVPARNFQPRSSSDAKKRLVMPYRMCLAGGWMDQPWVSSVAPGSAVTVALEPTVIFNDRSGMATSSRRFAREIWGERLPTTDFDKNARLLFAFQNPPGTPYVSGSQDAIGLVFPGVNRLDYAGGFWPAAIESLHDEDCLAWLEEVIYFIPLSPRPDGYSPLEPKNPDPAAIRRLGATGRDCFSAIQKKDLAGLGVSLTATWQAWKEILPATVLPVHERTMRSLVQVAGANFSGSGGGYIIAASDKPVADGFRIKVRRGMD